MNNPTRFRAPAIYPFQPVFASLLQNRRLALLISGIAALYLVLSSFGFSVWFCPVYSATGIRCPGCGLTHAVHELIRGHWRAALHLHAFAPVFVAGYIFMSGISLLPESWNKRCITGIADLERRTGFFLFIMVALVLYWIIRTIVTLV